LENGNSAAEAAMVDILPAVIAALSVSETRIAQAIESTAHIDVNTSNYGLSVDATIDNCDEVARAVLAALEAEAAQ
jgi:hypothetical protein